MSSQITITDPNNNSGSSNQQDHHFKMESISPALDRSFSSQVSVESIGFDLNSDVLLWDPKKSSIDQNTQLLEFQRLIEKKFGQTFDNYDQFYEWSVKHNLNFWEEFWHYSKIIFSKPYDRVLNKPGDVIDNLPFKWFEGSLLNYAENLLHHNSDKIAVYSSGESFTKTRSISFRQLRERVKLYQIALKGLGIKKNDVVTGYMPNSIECVEAKLATLSLGAIWSCTSPDFGPQAVIDRLSQVKPKVLFSIASVAYNGKIHDHRDKIIEAVAGIDSIEKVVVTPFLDNESFTDLSSIPKCVKLDDFLSEASKSPLANEEMTFEQVEFYHPLVILFSSGTTGIPKCLVHSHGGTLIQHLKEHMLHGNMRQDDIIFYYSTTGWMMYDWLLSSLAIGATVVLYDGSPVLPTINILWDLVDELKITMFGTSAKWISVIEDKKCKPMNTHKLDSLKIIFSTGSPLKPSSFNYIYNNVKSDVVLSSITGGSDIISLFCGANVNLPVYRGEIQCRQLAMAVESWNDQGEHVYNECGELVCTRPFPSMPVYFWGDESFKKYKGSYFEKIPGVWAHGDFCLINERTGGVVMLGRSDGTLNPNGVRFGSADIYNCVERIKEIEDSLCVGQQNPNIPGEERVVLFLKLKENVELTAELLTKVKNKIRNSLSARHVPSLILSIKEIPYTLNGKKVEVPVRRILEGHKIPPSSSLANPNALQLFENLEQTKQW